LRCKRVFQKVSLYAPLSPLTGEDSEWSEIDEDGVYQNTRCFSVFKDATGVYHADAIVWENENGGCFTDWYSRQPVVFPYIPERKFLPVSEHP